MTSPATSGRALPVLLALLAAAGLAVLFLGNPFGGDGSGGGRDATESGGEATRTVGPDAASSPERGATGLRGVYGEGDLGAVRLRLVDVRKAPVASRPVRLHARAGEARDLSTGADGVALFEAIAPGRGYRVEIAVEGFHPVTVQGVSVKASETTDLGDVMLGQNLVLQGRVVDVAGAAIPGAEVQAFRPDRSMALDGFLSSMISQATAFPTPADQGVTDAEGWFTLAALPEGPWRLVARKAGYATKQETEVVLAVDRAAKTLTLVLAAGATVKGRVTDETGKAVSGARVLALRDYGMRWQPGQGLEREAVRTDEAGRYVLDTLARGASYRFGVLAEGFAPLFDSQGREVSPSAERDYVLVRGGALAVTVRDQATGEPVVGAEVAAVVGRLPMGPPRGGRGGGAGPDAGGEDRVTAALGRTDEKGRLVVEGLMPGPVAMGQVRAGGYVPITASPFLGASWGEITAGDTLAVDLQMERGGVVEGTLQDAQSGAPIPGATVSVVPRENAWSVFLTGAPSAPTDPAGKFRIEGVRPGRYGLVAAAAGYASPSPTEDATTVTVPEDGTPATMALKLVAAGSVTGVVRDAGGEPVAGARVRARAAAPQGGGGRGGRWGGGSWRAFLPGAVTTDLTDQDGRYRIDGLASGERWVLAAESDEHVPQDTEPFEVAPGETKGLDLRVLGGGAVEGRVVDDQGRFVEGARVQLGFLPPDQATRRNLTGFEMDRLLDPRVHYTDADGRFFASNLRPGRTLVKAEKEGFVTFYKRDVEVRSDETIANYVVALSRGETVEGVVLDTNGRPVPNAVVAVTARRSPGAEEDSEATVADDAVEPQMSGRSDAEGRFRVENVMPGRTYSVVVWFAPGHQGWAGGQNESAIRRDVRVPVRDLEFRLAAQEASAFPGGGGFPGRGAGGGSGRGAPPPPSGGGRTPAPPR